MTADARGNGMGIGWGIWGPGKIAAKFARDARLSPDAELVACVGRNPEHARAFAREHGVGRVHDTFDAFLRDDGVAVVYVATPHPFHVDAVTRCLDAGKAVLCEKPLAMNAREARRMFDRARRGGLFLMEAMWTRFLPHIEKAMAWLADGRIGTPRLWRADFCYRAPWDPGSRLLERGLGGGGLLDVGIYPLSLASLFLGRPLEATAAGRLGDTGVDEYLAFTTRHPGDAVGSMACATRLHMPHVAGLYGDEGCLVMGEEPWWRPTRLEHRRDDGTVVETFDGATPGQGYQFEIEEVHRCLRAGLTESPRIPGDESVALMTVMDGMRERIGLRYPADDPEAGDGES